MSVLAGARLGLAVLPMALLRTLLGLPRFKALPGVSPTRSLKSMLSKARLSPSLTKRLLSALGTKALNMASMFWVLTLGMPRLAGGMVAAGLSASSVICMLCAPRACSSPTVDRPCPDTALEAPRLAMALAASAVTVNDGG